MKIVILDKDTLGTDADLSPIRNLGEFVEYGTTEPALVAERVGDAEVVVTNKIKLNETTLGSCRNVKLICVAATGYDNIDTEFCKERGIALCNVPGYSTDSVAQVTLAMALELVTHLSDYREFVHLGKYTVSGIANKLTPVYHELSSMTWGVVGGGAIGTKVAEIASAFGCKVLVCRRKQEGNFPLADIDTICEQADIISLHLPLSDSTRGILSRERINKCKKSAIIINTARGAVADEEALADAVKENRIGGLGVDVYSQEPFAAEHPYTDILGYKNVCLTPHMGWGSFEARNRCIVKISENIESFYKGENNNRIV